MDIETLWNEILEALEAEMPRASFETWVRDTRALAYENGVLTVGVRNAYARDWLENRVWAKVMRKLLERQADAQDLRFVVAEKAEMDEAEEAETETEAETSEIEVSAEAGSLYEQAVRPERAVYLPGYFRRWIQVLGPDLAWFYVGFRQAAYWAGGRSGQKSGRFSGKQISRLCGITERTFWNRVGRDAIWQRLSGLVSKGEGQRYAVAMSLPLMAADTRALARWLTGHLEACGGAQGVVEAACQAPISELLADDPTAEAEDFAPMSVAQLLRQMFPEADLKGQAERLRMHLMPQRDQIVISLFFLEHILPWLGAGAAWVYVLLRDRCYVAASGQGRDTVVVSGGYREIAAWLGIQRPRTVYDWLREPIARVYLVCERGESRNGKWENPLNFRVLLNDVPAEIVQAAAQGDDSKIFSFGKLGMMRLPSGVANFSVAPLSVPQFSESGDANFIPSVPRFSESGDANFIPSVPRFSEFCAAIFSALKPLTLKTEPLNPLKPDQPAHENAKPAQHPLPPSSVGRNVKQDQDSGWDFEGILQRLEVNPSSRQRLRTERVPAQTFVAWLLQAMTMKNVDPVRIAISWSLDPRKREGAGEEFKILAGSPLELRRAARENAIGYYRYSQAVSLEQFDLFYQRAFGDSQATARAILHVLYGERVEMPAQIQIFEEV